MKNASAKMVSTSMITALVHFFVKKGSRTSTTLIVAISTSVLPAFTTVRLINNVLMLMAASAVRKDC